MKRPNILRLAAKKAGLPVQSRKGDVIVAVCQQMSRSLPTSWEARYNLMRDFVQPTTLKTKPVTSEHRKPLVIKGETRRKRKEAERANRDDFLLTYEWRRLRMEVIKERGRRCECCGAVPSPHNEIVINVDHIKPRKLFPELALDKSNLQILCGACNHGKGNWDQTDWRKATSVSDSDFAPVWNSQKERAH
jgi:5-methylcytosine-specific restriction endonuclease McrA